MGHREDVSSLDLYNLHSLGACVTVADAEKLAGAADSDSPDSAPAEAISIQS